MYSKKLTVLFALTMILTLMAQVPRTLNYQGKLTDPDGVAIEGPVGITFRIYDDPTAGTLLWEEDHFGGDAIDVANGLFDVILGNLVALNLPFDEEYWVELEIEGEVLDPREKLSSVAYAYRAIHADTAEYVIGGGGAADNDWTERTTPADYIEAKAGGIASNGAVLHGTAANTHINLGYNSSVTGASGFDYTHCTVGGGYLNTASNTQATVAGGFANVASGNQSAVGGGGGNAAGGYRAVVAGGVSNTASGARTTIGGGQSNLANADAALVGGGNNNTASGQGSMVGAGEQNTSSNWYSVVAGGRSNTSEGYGTAIGGGRENTASDSFSVVSGGYLNTVINKHSAILGGYANRLTGEHSYLFGIADTVDYDSTFYVGSKYSRFGGEMHLGNVPDDGTGDSILTIDEGQVKKVAASSISGSDEDWSRSGNYVYTFNTTDSVGIGTTTPSDELHVVGNSRFAPSALPLWGTNPYLQVKTDPSSGNALQLYFHDGNTANPKITFATGAGTATIETQSNIGLNLDVRGTSTGSLGFKVRTDNGSGTLTDRLSILKGAPTVNAAFTNVNLGIGTTSPAVELDVNGTIRANAYRANDGTDLINAGTGIGVSEETDGSWTITADATDLWTDDSANDRIYNNNAITEYDRVLIEDDGDLQVTDGELRVMMVEPITPPSSVTTIFSGGNGGYGNMFDITTSTTEAVRIVELDCNIDRSESVTVDVYYRLNSSVGRESSSSGWILEGEYTVMAMGEGNPTNIVIGGVNIPASSTYGFYVLVTSGGYNPIAYTNGLPTNYTDGTLTIRTNCGNPGTPFGTPFTDRRWNGTVHYTTDAPSYIPLTISDGFIEFPEIDPSPTTPASGFGKLFVKDDSKIYFKDDAGTEYDLTSGGGGSDDDWAYSSGSGLTGDIYRTGDVAIGASSPDISAKLDVSSSDKGALFPRMSTESRDGIASPAQGLLIYNTDTDCFNYHFDGDWFSLCGELSSQDKLTYRYSDGTPYRFTNTTGSGMTVTVKCWGGGGGGNGNDELDQGFGGGGGFVQGDIYLADGEYLDIEPAEGGPVGGGGGASIITHSTNGVILVAGGGGGAGACGGSPGPPSSHGGAGGGFVGENGTDQSTTGTYTFNVIGGGGGTQSSGGLGGTAWTDRPSVSMCDGDDGGSLFGGTMYSGSSCASSYSGGNRDDSGNGCSNGCGGSGGSGYYGGGAGGSVYTYRGAGGGGGSSYYANWPSTRDPHFTIGGEGQIAGNMHDPDYQFSAGLGGYPGTPGKDGLVVIIFD